jgi:hypothetical protein
MQHVPSTKAIPKSSGETPKRFSGSAEPVRRADSPETGLQAGLKPVALSNREPFSRYRRKFILRCRPVFPSSNALRVYDRKPGQPD